MCITRCIIYYYGIAVLTAEGWYPFTTGAVGGNRLYNFAYTHNNNNIYAGPLAQLLHNGPGSMRKNPRQ